LRSSLSKALTMGATALLLLPAAAAAQDEPLTLESVNEAAGTAAGDLNIVFIALGTVLVLLMQAGFLLLEIGFSRGKNVGAGVAKILINLSIAAVVWWMVGFGLAFGGPDKILGDAGFFTGFGDELNAGELGIAFAGGLDVAEGAATGTLNAFGSMFFLFQFAFCAVSLAIVWGTTLERIKFIAYPIFAVVFAGLIYPLIAHWGFGGGWLQTDVGDGIQDFAGSSVVHLTGATAALAALLALGPRKGKYGADGKGRVIPGHNMPLFGLGVIILWLGWFGFNAGSTLGTSGGRFAEVFITTNLGAAAGVVAASILISLISKKLDVGMCGNGAIAGLVAITAPSGYVEFWAAPIIGGIGGIVVVYGILLFERLRLDDPVGALSAHGLAGIWGTLACGFFTSPRLAEFNGLGKEGLVYGGGLDQLVTQAIGVVAVFVTVFVLSYATFMLIKATFGLRVDEETEDAGLDIVEHGMYGYPEQFIPAPELVGYGGASLGSGAKAMAPAPTTKEVTA
jgi:ammonium transporter, Amt family